MKITYDRTVDAAYIHFVSTITPGAVKTTCPCDTEEIGAQINLDFDASGKLLGIEVLGASNRLPQETLEKADLIG